MATAVWMRPRNVGEASRGLREGRTVVGGGAALNSESFPPVLGIRALDLAALPEAAASIRMHDGGMRVAAMTTLQALLESPHCARDRPCLMDALAGIATPEVRRVATVGGTVAARLPTSDLLAVLCAHRSHVDLLDGAGRRYRTDIVAYLRNTPEAIVLSVELGLPRAGAYVRFAGRRGFAPAMASVAAVEHPDGLELWAGAAAATPFRLSSSGLPEERELLEDAYASAWYRRQLLAELRTRALAALATRRPDKETD